MRFKKRKHGIIIGLIIASSLIFAGGIFYISFFYLEGYSFEVLPQNTEESIVYPAHTLTGKKCENYAKRPYAVMLAEDTITRPLSGVAAADVVVEMPVVKDSITRMMALFVCEKPVEIGSVRSSRHDFIPLAASFDAIYAHWGGSYLALEDLNRGVIDNIDALINPYNVFFRKDGIYPPHDGFTTYNNLKNTAELLGYRQDNRFEGYAHIENNPTKEKVPSTISIEYPAPYNLTYIYSKETKNQIKFLKMDKIYEATFVLGEERDTDDVTGNPRLDKGVEIFKNRIQSRRGSGRRGRPDPRVADRQHILDVLEKFEGEQLQMPPIYSAKKVRGKKAYELARKGEKVELEPKKVKIYYIKLLDYSWPELKIETKVSSGTYIRALARDIGRELGTGAYVKKLIRTQIGKYKLKDTKTLEELKQKAP